MNPISKSQSWSSWLAKALLFFVIVVSFASCKEEEYRSPYFQTDEQREEQKRTDEKLIRKYFRDNNIDTTKVVRTNSGLYHLTKTPGTGVKVEAHQLVEVHYIGRNLYGQKFDSSYDRGKSFTFKVGAEQVIKGWDEGIKLMQVGEEGFLFVPSYLGYGYTGSGSIPPNSVLIFEIKVLSVK
jgi:peptidylprolyl isomerase